MAATTILTEGGTSSTAVPLMKDIDYEPFGPVSSWTWGNGKSYARTYDLDGRVTSFPLGDASENGKVRTLSYDAAGRIIDTVHSRNGTGEGAPKKLDQGYDYDNLDRLTKVSGNMSQAFDYDASGNRISATFGSTSHTNAINPASNLLDSTTGPAPAKKNKYDAVGNLISDGSISYAYSARGRMSSAIVGKDTVKYLYNGIDQRVMKSGPEALVQTGKHYFAYDEGGHIIGEYFADGAALEETVYLGDQPVAVLKQKTSGSGDTRETVTEVNYVYADQINTPRVITRASDNKMVWRWDVTDPFGLQQPIEDPSALGKFTYNARFPGQLYDRETNLHYNYHRDYDPQTGRYVQSDPIGLGGGINTYGYVKGNPLSKVDSLGLYPDGDSLPNRGGTLPGPVDVFIPGTQANNGIVKSLWKLIKAAQSSQSDLEECEANCDAEFDDDQKTCEWQWKMRGRKADDYRVCISLATTKHVKCYQKCAKDCKKDEQ